MGRAYRIAMLGLKLIGCTYIKASSGFWHSNTGSERTSRIRQVFKVFFIKHVIHTCIKGQVFVIYSRL